MIAVKSSAPMTVAMVTITATFVSPFKLVSDLLSHSSQQLPSHMLKVKLWWVVTLMRLFLSDVYAIMAVVPFNLNL